MRLAAPAEIFRPADRTAGFRGGRFLGPADSAGAAAAPLRLRAFKLVCSGFGLDFDQERLLRLDRCLAGTGTLQLAPHWRMVVDLSRAVLLREVPLEPISPLSIDLDGPQLQEIALPCGRILCIHQIAGQEIKFFVNKSGFQFENLLDCDRMYKIIRLRSRREGDVIRLAGPPHPIAEKTDERGGDPAVPAPGLGSA